MRDGGLLFSGVPEHDPDSFSDEKFQQVAQRFKVWYDKGFIEEKRNIRLPKIEDFHDASRWVYFIGAPKVQNSVCRFASEQLSDLFNNPRWSTVKAIGKGLKDTAPLAKDIAGHFVQASRHKRFERQHLHPEDGTPTTNRRKDLQQIRVEHCDVIMNAADPVYAERLLKVLKQADSERLDGAIMSGANLGETAFMGMHFAELFHAAHDLIVGSDEPPETFIDNPLTAFILSAGSICLAAGAHKHIGEEVSHIRSTLESRTAKISEELRPAIVEQYVQSQKKAESPHAGL